MIGSFLSFTTGEQELQAGNLNFFTTYEHDDRFIEGLVLVAYCQKKQTAQLLMDLLNGHNPRHEENIEVETPHRITAENLEAVLRQLPDIEYSHEFSTLPV